MRTRSSTRRAGLRPIERAGGFVFDMGDRQVEQIDKEVVSLCSFEPSNYAAFLFRVLPKLAGRTGAFRHRRLVAPLYFQSFKDFFAMAGIETGQLIPHETRKIYEYRKVIIPSLRNPHALLDKETRRFYASMRNRYGTRSGARKVFVTAEAGRFPTRPIIASVLNKERLTNELMAARFQSIARIIWALRCFEWASGAQSYQQVRIGPALRPCLAVCRELAFGGARSASRVPRYERRD